MKVGTLGGVIIGAAIVIVVIYLYSKYNKQPSTIPSNAERQLPREPTTAPSTPTTSPIVVTYVKSGDLYYAITSQGGRTLSTVEITKEQYISRIGGIAVYCRRYPEDELCSRVRM